MSEPTKLPVTTAPATPQTSWPVFDTLRREIDRIFETFHFASLRGHQRPLDFGIPFGGDVWGLAPAIDVSKTKDGFEIAAELPGMDAKDIEVRLADDTLTLFGEKRAGSEQERHGRYCSERRYGSFSRSFQVPHSVDADKIEASFARGVLTIKLPQAAASQAVEKSIDVKAA